MTPPTPVISWTKMGTLFCCLKLSPCCSRHPIDSNSPPSYKESGRSICWNCCRSSDRDEHTNLISSSPPAAAAADQDSNHYHSGYVSADGPSASTGGSNGANKTKTKSSSAEAVDSGLFSPSRTIGSLSRSHSVPSGATISTQRGIDLHSSIKSAYKLKDIYIAPTTDFLAEMDKLFMDCQVYLSELSTRSTSNARKEADLLVDELVALRRHWGSQLLPLSVCNAFVRERILLDLRLQHFRIDCAEFFEPVPFYSQSTQNTSNLVKLYRFSVYDLSCNEVVLRYFLERSNVTQLFHVLCFSRGNERGQVHPYGVECPTYWTVRSHMISDLCTRFQSDTMKS